MEHELKIISQYLYDVIEGRKTFEVRKNDRNFNVGDTLVLREYSNGTYLSGYAKVRVIYILNDPRYCKEGYVILGVQLLTFGSMA